MIPAALLGMVAIAAPAEAAGVSFTTLQTQVVSLSNQERVKAGCAGLRVNAGLLWAARGHSKYMAKTGKFSHTGTAGSTFIARASAAGYTAARSENIAGPPQRRRGRQRVDEEPGPPSQPARLWRQDVRRRRRVLRQRHPVLHPGLRQPLT